MPKSEWKDDGRRCHACKGTSHPAPLIRYYVLETIGAEPTAPNPDIVDMHTTCVGGWLMGNLNRAVTFAPGYPSGAVFVARYPVGVVKEGAPKDGIATVELF